MTDHRLSDRDIRGAFLARASGAPSADLADRIHAQTAATRQSRPFIVLAGSAGPAVSRLAWAAVLVALSIAVVGMLALGSGRNPLTSDAPTPSPSGAPSVAPSPSVDPSVDPSDEPSAAPSDPVAPSAPASQAPGQSPFIPADLGPDRIGIVVATDGLRVRTQPTVAETSTRLDPTLDEGVKLYVVAGPVFADGYAWYQVDPYGGDPSLPFGWVAAGSREGEPWIENHLDGCDTVYPSVELLGSQPAQESLYCYGVTMPDDYELTGNLVCEFGDIEGLTSGPEWIEFDRFCELRAPDWNIHDGGPSLRVWGQAATSLLDDGPVDGQYTVTGHFDDPGATECESDGFDGEAADPALVVLICRMAFVATEVTPAP